MEDAAEPVSSAYVKADDLFRIGDRCRDGAQRSRLPKGLVGLMGSVPIVEVFVLAQGPAQVAFVPQQAAVKQFAAARLLSMWNGGVTATDRRPFPDSLTDPL
ncbi:hypothetical protein J5X84_45000 [Streptosporangiaceae bacterium NEAU-GS5]|nr:hypothetical protein [Streptosporangiaceae bacterium NEAU-GS5]